MIGIVDDLIGQVDAGQLGKVRIQHRPAVGSHQTAFGAALDPVADKLLVLSAYILLYTKGLLPLWLSGVVVLREFVMLSIAAALKGLGRSFVTLPSRPGKITTVFHVSSAAYVLVIADAIGPVPPNILFVVTALITLYSGYGYSRNLIAQGFSGT